MISRPCKLVLYTVLIIAPIAAWSQEAEHVARGQIGDQAFAFRMLPPASFTDLPAIIRQDLEKRHCMVPQTYEAHTPENVVRGAFREKGSNDWAVLCSRNGTSTLLVYWNSTTVKPAEIAPQADIDTADPHGEARILGYARGIDAASPATISETLVNKSSGPFDHDGIKDSHIEQSAAIHYFRNGAWVTLEGNN